MGCDIPGSDSNASRYSAGFIGIIFLSKMRAMSKNCSSKKTQSIFSTTVEKTMKCKRKAPIFNFLPGMKKAG